MAFNSGSQAIERQTINLGMTINSAATAMMTQRRVDQSDIFSRISDSETTEDWDGLISMIESQIGKATSERVPDREFINQLDTKLASVRAKKKAWDLEQEFVSYDTAYADGKQTADSILMKLEARLKTVKEPNLVASIRDQIASMTAKRTSDENEQANIKLQQQQNDNYATQIYQEDINWAKLRLQEAVNNNNPLEIDRWKNITNQYEMNYTNRKIKVEDKNFTDQKTAESWNGVETFNYMKDRVNKADNTRIINKDGFTGTEKQYYQNELDNYIGGDFAKDVSNHMDNYFKDVSKVLGNYGGIPLVALDEFKSAITTFSMMPEFADKQDIITKLNSKLQEGVEKQIQAVFTASLSSEDFTGGLTDIQELGRKYNFDTTQYTDTLKDKTLQNQIDSQNLNATRQRLADAGLAIPDDIWNNALQRDVGPQEVMGASSFSSQEFAGFEQLQGRQLIGLGGKPISKEQFAVMTPEEKAQVKATTLGTDTTAMTTPAPTGQSTTVSQTSPITPATTPATTPTTPTTPAVGLNTPTPATPEQQANPFFLPDFNSIQETVRGLVDNGGNLIELTPELRRQLLSFSNAIPGIKQYVDQQTGTTSAMAEKNPDGTDKKDANGNVIKKTAVSATKIKQLVGQEANKRIVDKGVKPEDQPGYVKDIDAYNKELRKKQGRI